jgi:hypothetical protein
MSEIRDVTEKRKNPVELWLSSTGSHDPWWFGSLARVDVAIHSHRSLLAARDRLHMQRR